MNVRRHLLHKRLWTCCEQRNVSDWTRLFRRLLPLVLLCLLSCSKEGTFTGPLEMRFMTGDSSDWRLPDYRDGHWGQDGDDVNLDGGVLWLRWHLPLAPNGLDTLANPAMLLQMLTPYEAYCNGRYAGDNLLPGTSFGQGQVRTNTIIPLPGIHPGDSTALLAIRVDVKDYLPILLDHSFGDAKVLAEYRYTANLIEVVFATIYLVIAVYFALFILAGEEPRTTWAFVGLLLCASYISLTTYLNIAAQLNLKLHIWMFGGALVGYMVCGILITVFLYLQYGFRWFKTLLLLQVAVSLLFPGELSLLAGMCSGTVILLPAVRQRKPGARYMLAGIIACLLGLLAEEFWPYNLLDLGFLILLLLMNVHLLQQMRTRRREHQESVVRSARLEAQLLRKCIQPHFFLNSMNAVIDWIEEEPQKGIEFLAALSEEFQVISQVAQNKEISVAEEVGICEAHLKIMSCRKELDYRLETRDVLPEEKVPPAIFHTLIENGVKHGKPGRDGMTFLLTREALANGRRYRLFNSSSTATKEENPVYGTGLRYVEARLTESYGDAWRLERRALPGGYECLIDILENGVH